MSRGAFHISQFRWTAHPVPLQCVSKRKQPGGANVAAGRRPVYCLCASTWMRRLISSLIAGA